MGILGSIGSGVSSVVHSAESSAEEPYKQVSSATTAVESAVTSSTDALKQTAVGKTAMGSAALDTLNLSANFTGGLVKGTSGAVQGLMGLTYGTLDGDTEKGLATVALASNKFQAQLITDPRAALQTAQQTGSTVASAEWAKVKKNPGDAAGQVTAQVALAVATGGAGGAAEGTADAAVTATELADDVSTAADVAQVGSEATTPLAPQTESALTQAQTNLADKVHADWQTNTFASGKTDRFKPYKVDGKQVSLTQDQLPTFLDQQGVPKALQGNYRLVGDKGDQLEEDILHIPNRNLSANAADENNKSAQVVMNQIRQQLAAGKPLDSDFVERASDVVHQKWLDRNGEWAATEQKFSFPMLSTEEADKDRAMVHAGIDAYRAALTQQPSAAEMVRQATTELPTMSHEDVQKLLSVSGRKAPKDVNPSAWAYLMAAAQQEADRRGLE